MSRKTAAGRNEKMDSLIQAINRLAESQEKANENAKQSNEQLRQMLELDVKQYALNVDNHQYNQEQAKKQQEDLLQEIKNYVDEGLHRMELATNKNLEYIKSKIDTKADKVDEKELAEKVSKGLLKSLRPKGFIK